MTGRAMLALASQPDGGHDLYLDEDGQIAFVHEAEAVGQHARCRLMTHRGEWFLDTTAGVPWLDRILGRAVDLTLAESVIKAELLKTDGVTGLAGFDLRFTASRRSLDLVTADIETDYGAAGLTLPTAPPLAAVAMEDGQEILTEDGEMITVEG